MGLPLFVSMSLEAHVHRQFESERSQAMGVRPLLRLLAMWAGAIVACLLVRMCFGVLACMLLPTKWHLHLAVIRLTLQVARQLIRMKADGLKGVGEARLALRLLACAYQPCLNTLPTCLHACSVLVGASGLRLQ